MTPTVESIVAAFNEHDLTPVQGDYLTSDGKACAVGALAIDAGYRRNSGDTVREFMWGRIGAIKTHEVSAGWEWYPDPVPSDRGPEFRVGWEAARAMGL